MGAPGGPWRPLSEGPSGGRDVAVSAVREFKEGPSSADVLIVFRVGGPLKKGLRRVLLGAGGPPEVQRGPLRVDKKELKVYVLCECKQK